VLQQFSVARIEQQRVVVLTNTLFHDIDRLLAALIKPDTGSVLLTSFHLPVTINGQACFIDLLDIASVSAKRLKASGVNLQHCSGQIKAGIDLLIDGF